MNVSLNSRGSDFWFLYPPAVGELQARQKLRESSPSKALAMRPEFDCYGDRIPTMRLVDRLAVVPVCGPIVKGATGSDKFYYGVCSYEDIATDLDAAAGQDIRGILLHVRSPGGTVIGAQELASKIASMQRELGIPIHSFTDDVCASAAEYISAACEIRLTAGSAIVGSIGTVGISLTYEKALQALGVEVNVFSSGALKMGTDLKDMSREQKAFMDSFIQARGSEFKAWMEKYRGLKSEHMEGQVFAGAEAVQIGLHDATVSGIDEALEYFG